MLLYVLHEVFKSLVDAALPARLRQWYRTVDHVINAIMSCENKGWDTRVGKILGRWGELDIFPKHLCEWSKIAAREKVARKGLRLPKSASSKVPYKIVRNQADDPLLMDAKDEDADKLDSWRYSACFYLRSLSISLDVPLHVVALALYFFNRVYNRGIYGYERFRVATSALLLAAKTDNIRAKLFRYIRAMYAILERPLIEGDEEVEDLERIYLLHYELEIMAALDYEITVTSPFLTLDESIKTLVHGQNGTSCRRRRRLDTVRN